MRTTVNIPDEAFKVIKAEAEIRDISLGEAIGKLVMKPFENKESGSEDFYYISPETGFPVIKRRGNQVITNEMVAKAMEEEGF